MGNTSSGIVGNEGPSSVFSASSTASNEVVTSPGVSSSGAVINESKRHNSDRSNGTDARASAIASDGTNIKSGGSSIAQGNDRSDFSKSSDSANGGDVLPGGVVVSRHNAYVTIQTLGSGSGQGDDASSAYYGGGYTFETPSVGTLGAALGGVGGTNTGPNDVLLSALRRDLTPTTVGGQIMAISRLWPGSGRMMRSYRIKILVPRTDTPRRTALPPLTIEMACKSMIVRSEQGEGPLKLALAEGDAELKRLRSILSDSLKHPHALPYARWVVGSLTLGNPSSAATGPVGRPIYLLRQHTHASLSDRLFSRPFLTLVEKNWVTYQLLTALQSLHDAGVCHGHLTTENILLTSWNWVLISDVGCQHFKPIALPDDDPGLWIHWFEGRGSEGGGGTSLAGNNRGIREGRNHHRGSVEKKCCLAPERFFTPGAASNASEPSCAERNDEDDRPFANVEATSTPTKLSPAMDIFSLGCVLIELFLNGERAMDLGDLMEYRQRGDGPTLPQSLKQKLDKIESSTMRAACRHMLSLDPSSRLSAVEYLELLSSQGLNSDKKGKNVGGKSKEAVKATLTQSANAPIPSCFKTALFPLFLRLRREILSPDARIALVACHYAHVLETTVGVKDKWGALYFSRILGPTLRSLESPTAYMKKASNSCVSVDTSTRDHGNENNCIDVSNGESLERLLAETESILKMLDSGEFVPGDHELNQTHPQTQIVSPLPNHLIDSSVESPFSKIGRTQPTPSQLSMILLLQVVFSSVRHVQRPSSKLVALKLMHRIGLFSPDEVRLQRIVPFAIFLLQDSEPIVRASAISVLASILSVVGSFPPSDAHIFPRYVFKKVAHLITDSSLMVRIAFAQNIALLAETSLRFLDVGHSVSLHEAAAARKSNDNKASYHTLFSEDAANLLGTKDPTGVASANAPVGPPHSVSVTLRNSYDTDLAILHEVVLRWVVHITTDTSDHSSQSKQALLRDLPRLCNFFGGDYSFQILPQILAFLNDRKDWQLRAALCRHLPYICVFVGRVATEQFVIPCIETALTDDEEQVVIEALCCLKTLTTLMLLTKTTLLGTDIGKPSLSEDKSRTRRKKQGVIKKCAPLLLHSSHTVRTSAVSMVFACCKVIGGPDAEIYVTPILKPYLRYNPVIHGMICSTQLAACLQKPNPKRRAISDSNSWKIPKDLQDANTTHRKQIQPDLSGSLLIDIDSEVEVSPKLAYKLFIPNHQLAGPVTSNVIEWYESLQCLASRQPKLCPPFFPLSFKSLQEVYRLDISLPPDLMDRSFINWSDEKAFLKKNETENEFSDEFFAAMLSRPEVRALESACRGQWGSVAVTDQLVPENSNLHSQLQSLDVPPFSRSLGRLLEEENFCTDRRDGRNVNDDVGHQRKPREDNIVGSTSIISGHNGPVNRLAVSTDHTFFVSASSDGTSRVFELRQSLDSGGELQSCITYDGHQKNSPYPRSVRVNDLTILENSLSVVTAASDGSLRVWKVDTVTSKQSQRLNSVNMPRVSGHRNVHKINSDEGEILAVSHFNTSSASIVAYATQGGRIHSLDLRCSTEPFFLTLRPELGYLTSMEVGHDRNWIVAGTNRGYLGLWDIRFQKMVKLWQHSSAFPIKRVINSSTLEEFCNDGASRPQIFMASGSNETSLFDVSTGHCIQCFRVLDTSLSLVGTSALPPSCLSMPLLEEVKIRRLPRRQVNLSDIVLQPSKRASFSTSVNALVGSFNIGGPSYLMTGGSDRVIRYWDMSSSSKSRYVTGSVPNHPLPIFESIEVGPSSRLNLCRQPPPLATGLVETSKMPFRSQLGLARYESGHKDSILDIKQIKYPMMGVLSASRDGAIKLWS